MGDGSIEIQQAIDQPEIMGCVADLDKIISAGVPSGRAGGDGAGRVAGGKFAAVGDVDFAIFACAFGKGAEVDVGPPPDESIVHQQAAVEVQLGGVQIELPIYVDGDA